MRRVKCSHRLNSRRRSWFACARGTSNVRIVAPRPQRTRSIGCHSMMPRKVHARQLHPLVKEQWSWHFVHALSCVAAPPCEGHEAFAERHGRVPTASGDIMITKHYFHECGGACAR